MKYLNNSDVFNQFKISPQKCGILPCALKLLDKLVCLE